jgi:hypothetical protein
MKHRSPLVTLLAAAAVFAVLVVVNMTSTAGDREAGSPPATLPPTPQPTLQLTSPQPTPPPSARPTPSAPSRVFPAKALYAGRTAGREFTIAVAVLNGRAAGYICDGRSVEAWLTGTAVDGMVALRSKRGAELQAWLDGDKLSGSLSVNSIRHGFTVRVAGPPAALYRGQATVDGRPTTIGWIVLPDGSQVGISASGATRTPAPTLRPEEGGVVLDGTRVPARPVTGDTTF